MARTLHRRTLLRGIGGVALALPFLEIMKSRRASADALSPRRYVFAFAGSSLGMDATPNMVVPLQDGPGYDITRGLKPIGDFGVQQHVSVVSGMKIPWDTGGGIPAGGRAVGFHAHSVCPLICGVRSISEDDEGASGPTSDWIVAEKIAGETLATNPVLNYRVQPAYYRGTNGTGGERGRISARMVDGQLQPQDPNFSPRSAWSSLFTNFIPPDPAEAAAAEFLLRRRKSVIDLVKGDTERLMARLGGADRQRMERHFDELRGLELRLGAVAPPATSECSMLADPGTDPDIGGAVENGDTDGYSAGGAWSDEEARANVFIDLIHMAFVCDLSRVSTLMFTWAQCFMNMNPLYQYPSDLHELSHYSVGGGEAGTGAVADGVAWHVKHFARLVAKLADTPDIDGAPLIDSTAMILAFEGGHGHDPEGAAEDSPHSTENMAVLIAGHAGGLNPSGGKHVRAPDRHPVEVINTAMHALGVEQDLGEVSGDFPELFA